MNPQEELLAEVTAFLEAKQMADSTFGKRALNDGKFVPRLRSGCNMTVRTVARVRQYIETASASVAA